MKKIKRIKDVSHEKLRLRVLQLEQEKLLQKTWNEMKEDAQPLHFIYSQWQQFNSGNQDAPLFERLVNCSTNYISRHFGEWAGNTFHEKLDKLSEALKCQKSKDTGGYAE
ncbi:MAG: hypothetical protein IPH18_11960 [Chitinophagaceae bacterium]|nr:hypothetical protein [Chitinophagaceae bacterium]MBK8952676.1 hypothetical protein [Chitinophagaceae bacterium]